MGFRADSLCAAKPCTRSDVVGQAGVSIRSLSRMRLMTCLLVSLQVSLQVCLQMSSQMKLRDSIPWAPLTRCPAWSKRRTQRLPRWDGRMRQNCRQPHSTLGASPSAEFTTLGHSVMDTHRSDVAGHPGASKRVEAQCTRADAVGTVAQSTVAGTVAQSTVAGTVARSTAAGVAAQSMVAQPGIFIQVGGRAPSVGPITQATSASAIARCIAATTMATTWIAPLALRHPGGVDEFLLVIDAF